MTKQKMLLLCRLVLLYVARDNLFLKKWEKAVLKCFQSKQQNNLLFQCHRAYCLVDGEISENAVMKKISETSYEKNVKLGLSNLITNFII